MNSDNINKQSTHSDEISLKELIIQIRKYNKFLFSKWLIIVVFGLVGMALGYIYACSKTTIYSASTTFVLEEDKGSSGLGSLSGLASMAGVDLQGSSGIFQGDNILELYKSRSMIEKTLMTEVEFNGKQTLLIDRYLEFNKLRATWATQPELAKLQFAVNGGSMTSKIRMRDSVMGLIVSDINRNYLSVAKLDKKLSIIKAEVKAPDEKFAKAFNDEIVKNVNNFYVQTKTKKSIENIAILQQKTDSVRRVMNGAIYSAAAISDATPNLNPTRQVQRVAPVQRSQASVETNKAVLSILIQNLEMSKISQRREAPLIQVIDQPIFPLEVIKVSKKWFMILGGLIAGFTIVLILTLSFFYKKIMSSE